MSRRADGESNAIIVADEHCLFADIHWERSSFEEVMVPCGVRSFDVEVRIVEHGIGQPPGQRVVMADDDKRQAWYGHARDVPPRSVKVYLIPFGWN